jgi:diguanylate cyclase (GGDEF)-like protein/PAS domain S-box-containing protein
VNDLDQIAIRRLLDRFYGIFAVMGAVILLIGVPFVFVQKTASAVLAVLLLALVFVAWRVSRAGQPQRSLILFAAVLWAFQVGLIYGGLPPGATATAIAVAAMLAVVVGTRAGIVYGLCFLAAWLSHIVLAAYGLAPPPFFPGRPIATWFVGALAIWLVLLPIPELVMRLREALARAGQLAAVDESLRASEAKYRELVENASVIILRLGLDGRVTYFSEFAEQFFGFSAAEILGRHVVGTIVPERESVTNRDLSAMIAEILAEPGRYRDNENENITRDGKRVFVHWTNRVILDPEGRPSGLLAVGRDVTERRRAEQSLQEAKAYSENLLCTASVMVVELDREGNVQAINPAAERITGYAGEELKGCNWFATVTPRDRFPQVWDAFAKLAAGGHVPEFENPILTRSGAERYISWRNSQVVKNGQVVGTVSFGIDITDHRNLERRLAASEARLNAAQRVAQIGSWEHDHATDALTGSAETYRIYELNPGQATSHEAFVAVIHPEDQERVRSAYAFSLTYHRPYDSTHRLLLPDGTVKYVHARGEPVFDDQGKPLRTLGTVQDVTDRVLQEQVLRESEERFRTIADYTYDWEYWQGPGNEMLYISPACKRISGYSQADFISDPNLLNSIVHPDDQALYASHRTECSGANEGHVEFRIVTKGGDVRWIAHGCRGVFSQDGRPLGRRASNRDITDLKAAEQTARQLAFFDSLTGLPNRRLLQDRLNHGLAQAARHHRSLAVMFLDLDRFKHINDTLGHDIGDAVLVEVATRLAGCIRAGDTVARSGGDEFIAVLPEIAHPQDATIVAQKILQAVAAPIRVGSHLLDVTVSIGVAIYPVDGTDDALELMKKADIAMYAAKQAGRNACRMYEVAAAPGDADPQLPALQP